MCCNCRNVGHIVQEADGDRCGNPDCRQPLKACANNTEYANCNGYLAAHEADQRYCTYCRLNDVIPDPSIAGHIALWTKLEVAKRRVLHGVEDLGFPILGEATASLPLSFSFKSAKVAPVATGHLNGCITIRLEEADEVQREKTRVEFDEPQRTLVGHFRHELGHYYWELLVKPTRIYAFREVFGDENQPSYPDAQRRHYQTGPVENWQSTFISAYASMHPWEDFAESFGAYLDMAAVLRTARHFQLTTDEGNALPTMISAYRSIGVAANELNRDIGLTDLVPEVWTPAVLQKMEFIHGLRPRFAVES